MTDYEIGQIFTEEYPQEAAEWCNENNCYIEEIEALNNVRRFEIKEQIPYTPTPEDINNLTMTALDFINFLKTAGLTDLQIDDYLNSNIAIKHQLQFCQSVWCGVAKSLMPITFEGVTITADMVEQAFKDKAGL